MDRPYTSRSMDRDEPTGVELPQGRAAARPGGRLIRILGLAAGVAAAAVAILVVQKDHETNVRTGERESQFADAIEMTLSRGGTSDAVTDARPGEELELRFVAKTREAERYGRGLTSRLEQLVGGNWKTVYGLASPLPQHSDTKPTFVRAGETLQEPTIALLGSGRDRIWVPPDLDEGTYRICKNLDNGGSMDSAPLLVTFDKCVQLSVVDRNAG